MNNTKWQLDPAHSELTFKIKHLMISNVSGAIRNFQVIAALPGEDFTQASIILTADVTTITTYNEQRDAHLRSNDFFDTESYPELRFQSTSIKKIDAENFTLYGDLTLKGVTRPVKLDVESGGILNDPQRGKKAGFTVTGKINRSDWGISFNRVLESGGLGLGEEIKIISEIQLAPQV